MGEEQEPPDARARGRGCVTRTAVRAEPGWARRPHRPPVTWPHPQITPEAQGSGANLSESPPFPGRAWAGATL